ncbi:predicted protein [Nematostella vectensis]|uniref:Huntingtin n=1 Tax=Nematostella vectensis TaxID=45351 RepID=A7RGU1_NEMVE|nr:predicted protein [Nematostella vectensis]|eukprot:XP_001641177.1 predicted protein [Nematostella vectensis]
MSLAVADKLLKNFEALKNFREGIPVTDTNPLAKKKEGLLPIKDRISHINSIPELLCSTSIKGLQEFPKLLAIGIDTLLGSCDEDESDVRLVAGEALNKLIKGLLDSNVGRLLVELYKEIKKNGSARSLRAAIQRFGEICHLIRPQKCRICMRTEEAIQETLAVAVQKIFPVLGSFTSDNEVKQLMKAFLPNLRADQAMTRRTAGTSLAIICHHSRKPSMFHEWLLNILLGMVLPFQEVKAAPVYLGVLNCLRQIIPNLDDMSSHEEIMRGSFGVHMAPRGSRLSEAQGINIKQLLQMYEVLMHCTKHSNHNVVNASLETLQQLLRTPPAPLLEMLLSSDGIVPTIKPDTLPEVDMDISDDKENKEETASIATTETSDTGLGSEVRSDFGSTADLLASQSTKGLISVDREGLVTPQDSDEQLAQQIQHLGTSDKDTQNQTDEEEQGEEADTIGDLSTPPPSSPRERSVSDPGYFGEGEDNVDEQGVAISQTDTNQDDTEIPDELPRKETDRLSADLGELGQDLEPIRTESVSTQEVRILVESSFEIEAVACEGVPLVHCVRLMCSFLLTGRPGEVLPDSNVRVSVKSLALACIAQAIRLYPESFLGYVVPSCDSSDGVNVPDNRTQLVRDILQFNAHPDPQLRGALASVIGLVISAGMKKGRLDFEEWSNRSCEEFNTPVLSLPSLLSVLGCILQDDSPVAIRQACAAVKVCFNLLCSSPHCSHALDLVHTLAKLKNNSYWLVKVELLELIAEVDFRLIAFLETSSSGPDKNHVELNDWLLSEVVFVLLGDADGRVRHAAADCCVSLVPRLLFCTGDKRQNAVVQSAEYTVHSLSSHTYGNPVLSGPPRSKPSLEPSVSRLVSLATETLGHSTSKYLTVGCIHLLYTLSQSYPVSTLPGAWGCSVGQHCHSPVSPYFTSSGSPPRPGSPSMTCTGGGGPLSLAVACVTSSWLGYDLNAHQNLLLLSGQLLFGIGCSGVQASLKLHAGLPQEESSPAMESWNPFADLTLAPVVEKLVNHLVKILNIYAHVIDGNVPGAHSFKLSFPGQNKDKDKPSSQSPVPGVATPHSSPAGVVTSPSVTAVPKRLLKSKRAMSEADLANTPEKSPSKTSASPAPDTEQTPPHPPPPKSNIGTFHQSSHYMKLYDVIRGTHHNYQVFISYVQKQFEYVDAGQIRDCDTFLPYVFQFLVLLSYDCYQPKFNQAKAIVGMAKLFGLFMLHVTHITSSRIVRFSNMAFTTSYQDTSFLVKQFTSLTLFATHVFMSKRYPRITQATASLCHSSPTHPIIPEICKTVNKIIPTHPLSVLQWCKHVEEILGYLQACAKVEPCKAFLSVQQLLRAMFGINAVSQPELVQSPIYPECLADSQVTLPLKPAERVNSTGSGLYYGCFVQPLEDFRATLEKSFKEEETEGSIRKGLGSFFKKFRKRSGSLIRPAVKLDKGSPIHSFIRLFEPLVIRALKEYTLSACATLQQQVLSLLAQLIKLRVNYALLDADQVFISYVQKQFEYVDAGQIRDCDTFLPYVFQFLVLLSYDCYQPKFNQAKAIVGMAKVIQLCDGIMASGQSAKTHGRDMEGWCLCFYGLYNMPRAGNGGVVSMLLRLVQHAEGTQGLMERSIETLAYIHPRAGNGGVVSMLLRLVQHAECYQREDEEKWKKLSRQVIDMLLPLLAKQQALVETSFGLDALRTLFQSVSEVALHPADVLLKTLFFPVHLGELLTLERWLSMVLVLLHTVAANITEEQLLSRISQMNIKLDCLQGIVDDSLDSSPNEMIDTNDDQAPPAQLFGLFMLHVTHITSSRIVRFSNMAFTTSYQDTSFLVKQFTSLTLFATHVFMSKRYPRITQATASLCHSSPTHPIIPEICKTVNKIIPTHPLSVLQWCKVLQSIGYADLSYWYNLIGTCSSEDKTGESTMNREIVRQGATLLYCDLLMDKEETSLEDMVRLDDEPPVTRLIRTLHGSADGSRVLLETFIATHALGTSTKNLQTSFPKRLVRCLVGVHSSQTCLLLKILAEFFLNSHCRAIRRLVENNICKRLEANLPQTKGSPSETVNQELIAVCNLLASKKSIQRNPRLHSLVHRILQTEHRPYGAETRTQHLVSSMKDYTIDQEWFSRLVSHCCCATGPADSTVRPRPARESVQLLSALEFSTVCNIMASEDFDLHLLEDCVLYGVERTLHFTARRMNAGQETAVYPYENTEHFESTGVDHLLLAAKLTLFRHLASTVEEITSTVHSTGSGEVPLSSRITLDKSKLDRYCKDASACRRLLDLSAGLMSYCSVTSSLPRQCELSPDERACLCRFAFIPLAVMHQKFQASDYPSSDDLGTAVECLGKASEDYTLPVNGVEFVTLLCAAINHVYSLLRAVALHAHEHLTHGCEDDDALQESAEFQTITFACDQISDLVHYVHTQLEPGPSSSSVLPLFLMAPFKSAIVGLARRPLVNSYARTPPLVWKFGWMPTPEGPLKTELPPLPIEILKEKDVLNEFVIRVNILGWINRQQFEETWAALLGVLSSPPLPDSVTPETTLYPASGNCTASGYLHGPRHRDLPFLGSRAGKKLAVVRGIMEEEFITSCCAGTYLTHEELQHERSASLHRTNSFTQNHGSTAVWTSNKLLFDHPLYGLNVDRIPGFHDYTLGQLSVQALHSQAQAELQESPDSDDEAAVVVSVPHMPRPEKLDIRSCLQFLLELFEQWMSPYVQPRTPLMLLSEATKALVVFSDLFVDGHHFEWVLDTLLDLHHNHPTENDLLTQYLLPVICKALAFLKTEGPTAERVCKIVESSLRSPHVPLQVSLLYKPYL